MKTHQNKFELRTVAPVPVLQSGAMVRKGQTGKQAEDGMNPEISAQIRAWAMKMVQYQDALDWMYNGGTLPKMISPFYC